MLIAIRSWLGGLHQINTTHASIGLGSRYWRQFYHRTIVKEGDVVLLRRKSDHESRYILTKPLQSLDRIQTPRGFIETADIIGKGVRDVVSTNSNIEFRIYQPTLAEYTTLSPRLVTPVYPANANLIVSLLDLHPPASPKDCDDEPLEILEAGTGHGSLTLHLARAIHSFNPAPPPIPSFEAPKSSSRSADPQEITNQEVNAIPDQSTAKDALEIEAVNKAYEAYLPTRRAVVQTLDVSPQYSKQAERTIRRFRQGLYWHNINFNTGTIAQYLSSRLSSPSTAEAVPFLAHTILDLPDPHNYLDMISQALQPDGALIIFCPNITQITKCVMLISEKRLPFVLEKVLEVGAGVSVGGREWDVMAVKPRGRLRAKAKAEVGSEVVHEEGDDVLSGEESSHSDAVVEPTYGADEGWEMRCRPTVGGQITVGGFIGLWRRMNWER